MDQPLRRPLQRDLELRIGRIRPGFAQIEAQALQEGRPLPRAQRLRHNAATVNSSGANRENAKKSIGPKTAGGRARSSHNALSHGLSLPLTLDAEAAAKAGLIRQMLVSEPTEPSRGLAAVEVAEAHLAVLRIRAVRRQMMLQLESASGDLNRRDAWRRALTRRSRASSKLLT
jgi:hypothetical protein